MRKQFTAAWLLILMLLTLTPAAAEAGFVSTQEGVKYTTSSGQALMGLQRIKNKYYLFDENGVMQKGIRQIGAKYYFFSYKTGQRLYGWISYGGKKYYAHKKTGALFISRKKGKYYFGADGALVKGGVAGAAGQSGWYKKGSKTYYYDSNHQKVTGLYQIGSRTYYFSPKGLLKRSRIIEAGGARYYVGKKGYILKGRFVTAGGKKYYASAGGTLATGVTQIGNKRYFFLGTGALSGKGLISWNGKTYYVQKTGTLLKDRWVKYKKKYYYITEDGSIATNRYIGKYYVGLNGVRKAASRPASGVASNGGRVYYYGTDGIAVASQWISTSDGKRYYFGADGAAVTGLQIIGGYKYYFDADGVLQTDAVVFAGGYCYYTDSTDGHIVSESKNTGNGVVAYAKQFVGNPYVYGGTSLTKGADCSGFTQSVLAHFGIRIMRVAVDQMNGATDYWATLGYAKGIQVSDANLQPGDLVFYGSGNYASHVAIYMGNGKVVHAANSRVGIIISSIDYVKSRLHNKNRRYWA